MTAAVRTITAANTASHRRAQLRKVLQSYLLLSPFLILFIVFVLWPLLQSAYLSLTKFTAIKPPEFIGFKNFVDLASDTRFLKSMVNIAEFVILSVSLNTIVALALALTFRGQGMLNQILRTAFFLPAVTSSIAVGSIWRYIFNGEDYGLANTILRLLGMEPIRWLATPGLAIPIIVLIGIWGGVGMGMIFFLAGLQSIPGEVVEAGAIDGATGWNRLRYITLPLLKPTFVYVIITGLIGAFQLFDTSYVVFSSVENVGGPLDSALTPVLYLYYRGFGRFQLGYASAIAWVLFAVIAILSLVNLRVGRASEDD